MLTDLHTMIAEVTDMARSNAFYRDVLGLTPEFESVHWSSYRLGSGRIGLHPPFVAPQPGTVGGWVLGVQTADLADLRKRLVANNVVCGQYHAVPGGVVMDFPDPDGNRIQAIQVGAAIDALAA